MLRHGPERLDEASTQGYGDQMDDSRQDARPVAVGIRSAFPLERLDAVVFDMDGVVTQTAVVHFRAWKALFDGYVAARSDLDPKMARPFDEGDYRRFVDGKPREAGVRDFLASRGIVLPEGSSDDGPERDTVAGLGNRKNEQFVREVETHGVEPFTTTVAFVDRLHAADRRVAVISASKNATQVLEAAGVLDRFDAKVDGLDAVRLDLPGKPDPAVFVEAARELGSEVPRTAVVEDALAGVEAGVSGGFGFVLGVDRAGFRPQLEAAGASLVVSDLGELLEPVGSLS
jgi:HAD superfamily hydrolase (TIGR01509 family)